jgi:beta-glucosidase
MLALHGDVLQAGQDNVVPTPDGLDNVRRRITLTEGAHPITVEVKADPSGNPVQIRLAWVTPEQRARDRAAAVAAAKGAKTAVVFAWGRGKPDPLALAGDQDALIDAVAAANPNTVVVLNTDSPVAMPWLPKVKAVLQMWYTGDEGGWAAADILTGRVSPAGRLPFTWPKQLRDAVANDPAHPERSSVGAADGKTTYAEGILVGYRWFDRQHAEPLFPFGYGLSYSRFDYAGLRVADAADGGLDVRFTLKNVGAQAAAEVPQVYVGPPATAPQGAQFADRSLVAFDRVTLAPNESKEVTLHVAPRRLQYWSDSQNGWRSPAGSRPLWVGASSRDVRLTGATAP